jgi:type VI protein secretion system component VasK
MFARLVTGVERLVARLVAGVVRLVVTVVAVVLLLLLLLLLVMVVATGEELWKQLLAFGLIVLLIVLFFLYTRTDMILRHQRLKRQQDIEILNTDVRKIGDDEVARLAKKYRNK